MGTGDFQPLRRAQQVRPKWEYKVRWLVTTTQLPDEKELNGFGEEGWELAGIYMDTGTVRGMIYKRPK